MLEQLTGAAGLLVDVDLLGTYVWRLLDGLRITLEVVVISCSLGFVLACPLARARMSRNRLVSAPALAYVTFFRGTPLLCQLLPGLLWRWRNPAVADFGWSVVVFSRRLLLLHFCLYAQYHRLPSRDRARSGAVHTERPDRSCSSARLIAIRHRSPCRVAAGNAGGIASARQ